MESKTEVVAKSVTQLESMADLLQQGIWCQVLDAAPLKALLDTVSIIELALEARPGTALQASLGSWHLASTW